MLMHHRNEESATSGIVISPDGPLTIASRPIINSQGSGPIRGTVIFARRIDSGEISHIGELTHLSLCVLSSLDHNMPADMLKMESEPSTDSMIVKPRGVGMDVVQNTILETLDGSIAIDSVVGKGTTFTIKIPIGTV